jgi:hypothetical protein
MQKLDGKLRPIAYASRLLTVHERNYTITELEALSVIYALDKFRPYCFGLDIIISVDHCALCALMKCKQPKTPCLQRWLMKILEYGKLTIVYKSGKAHSAPDCLSRMIPFPEKEDPDDNWLSPVRKEIYTISLMDHREDLRLAQREDPTLGSIIKKIEITGLPRPFLSCYALRDGVLIFKDELHINRIAVPSSFIHVVLRIYHDSEFAGHFGIQKTLQRISAKFHWPSMAHDVKRYVQSCDVCNRTKPSNHRHFGLLNSREIPAHPFEVIYVDLS